MSPVLRLTIGLLSSTALFDVVTVFERSLQLTDFWVFKFGEWALVILLAIHLSGGVRILIIEFGAWRGLRKGWIEISILFSIVCGLLFLYLAN